MHATSVPKMADEPLPQEIEDLFQDHYLLVYRTAYGITGRVEDAEDVVQTIFLRLLQRERPPDLSKNPKGYFYRAAVNLSLSTLKARRRHEHSHVSDELANAVPTSASTRAEELHRTLYGAIAELSSKAASIVVLRYLHSYSDAEIAKVLGTSRGVIAVTLYRARIRLKKLMATSLGDAS
jgi:RNA polymerase sigma-70 factor (ECF subfamily)